MLLGYSTLQGTGDILEINGSIGALYTSLNKLSDERVKSNIQSLDPNIALNAINALQLRTFNFTNEYHSHHPTKPNRTYCGVIAQELEQIPLFANNVFTNDFNTQFYDYETYNKDCENINQQNEDKIGEDRIPAPNIDNYKTVEHENLKHINLDDLFYASFEIGRAHV